MNVEARKSDLEIIDRYVGQPSQLPRGLRDRIEQRWGEPVVLYGLADLDAGLRLARTWVVLGPAEIAVVRETGSAGTNGDSERGVPAVESFEISTFPRSRVEQVESRPGLSCHVLTLLAEPDEPPLAVLRFTNRQRQAMENIQFTLEQALEGLEVPVTDADAEYVEGLAKPVRDAQALVAKRRFTVLWRLLGYLKPYRRNVTIGMGAASLLTVFTLIPPYLTGYLIDEVIEPAQSGALPLERASTIAWIAVGAMAVIYVLRQLSNFVRLRLMAVLGENVARDLRTELFEHMQTLSLSFFGRKKTGSLITRVSSDTDRLWDFLAFGVVDVSLSLITLLGLGVVLMYLDWRLGVVMTLPVPFLIWAIAWHGRRMNEIFLRAWRKWSYVTDLLSDTIPGMRVVKAFHQESREAKRFNYRNYDVAAEFNAVHAIWTTFWPILMVGVHSMILLVWVFALPRLLGTSSLPELSPGTFVAFLLYMTMFVGPIEIIGQVARIMNRATTSAHRVFEILDTRAEIVDVPEPTRLEPVQGRVTFDHVTFGYDGVRQVIRAMSFDVQPGEMIGLVGPSGGGKTTVINLIARFYEATGGSVRIDGVDVKQLDTGHTRQQIGMVLQDPYLFHGTILENIRYGQPDAAVDRVVAAAQAANAHDFICKTAHGYDTMVGERGQTLSGGERQRISIARAILHDPRILILDEATSSVDTETEWHIQEALERLIAGRTVFAIAHRLSTLTRASRLFVIEDGRIKEQGTHATLLANENGTYRRLHDMQVDLQAAV
ncbi:MAG: ATP-binding cassette domain-containing protein [Deltaproteobacteria bacterium]|nr:ATP-binding cassette domain-containing protein [Deltaproteobacteria bacterium]MBW2415544.1 ATP-binding cassette domain-containing protein [Deltaproteobacteria bacterium]